MNAGLVPTNTGSQSGAAYPPVSLHTPTVRVVREGRYETAPFRPYVYGASNDVTRAAVLRRVSRNLCG